MAIKPHITEDLRSSLNAGLTPLADAIRAIGGIPIPTAALVFYDFSYEAPATLLEQVNKQVSMLTLRDANQNVEQLNGTIKTYTQGEAGLVVGSGALIEDAATNLQPNSSNLTGYAKTAFGTASTPVVTPNYGMAPDGTMTATRVQMSLNGGTTSGDFSRVYENIAGLVGSSDYSQSLWLKSNDASTYQVGLLIGSQSSSDNYIAGQSWDRQCKTINSAGYGNQTGIQVRGTYGHSDTVDILVWTSTKAGLQLEQASTCSSFIYTSGGPATRDACNCTLDTKLEMGALLETPANSSVPCTLANRDADGYTNGVNTSSLRVSFATGTPNGKYPTLPATAVGAVLSVNNSIIQLSTYVAPGIFTYDLIKGDANDFQHPNTFSINWNRSAYTEAQVITLRTTAGDANVWPAAVAWPVNNFILSMGITPTDIVSNGVLFSATTNETTDRFQVYITAAGKYAFQHRVASVDHIFGTTVDAVVGEMAEIEIIFNGGSKTFTVNGESVSQSYTADAGLNNFATLCAKVNKSTANNALVSEVLLRQLT